MKIILKKAIRVDGTTFPAGTHSTGRTDCDGGETWVEYFYLDGVWKVLDAHTNTVLYRFPGALDICAWLNRNQYQPSPNERVEIIP